MCIVVHGSFVDWTSVCKESLHTYRWLQNADQSIPLQMIYLTWPSDESITPFVQLDINVLGRRAARNGYYLADLVQHIPAECPICLLGHSHGTRVISSSLHLMAGGAIQEIQHPTARSTGRRIRAVYFASAIDHDWLNPGHRYDRALCSTECLLNVKNSEDPALWIYPLGRPFASRALGHTGFTSHDRRDLRGWSAKVQDLDLTETIGMKHLWPEYFNRPWIAQKIRHFVYFTDTRH